MGLSYNIIPTNEMNDREAYIEHFETIETFGFPVNFEIDTNSRYPRLSEIELIIDRNEFVIKDKTEELREDETISRSYQLNHPNHENDTDFTIHYKDQEITSMMGIHGDFNMLLKIATEITKYCGTMIIWSAYDAHYIEKGNSYDDIWGKLKVRWLGNE